MLALTRAEGLFFARSDACPTVQQELLKLPNVLVREGKKKRKLTEEEKLMGYGEDIDTADAEDAADSASSEDEKNEEGRSAMRG